jgi:hypothetical protein
LFPAKLDHFRHEWQVAQRTIGVKCLEDFVGSFHFHEITRVKSLA